MPAAFMLVHRARACVVEVPLGETNEAYEIEVLDDGVVKRTLHSTTSEVVYSLTDQAADFGTPRLSYQIRVYQLSAVLGRGSPAEAIV